MPRCPALKPLEQSASLPYSRGTNIQAGKDAKFTASPQSTEVKSTEGHPTLGAFCALFLAVVGVTPRQFQKK